MGFSHRNSSYLIGLWRKHSTLGWQFKVIENKSVKFVENIIISNLEQLRPDRAGIWVPNSTLDRLGGHNSISDLSVVPDGSS
ncbi:MAG: hypothetical protein CMB97_00435 [Flavobacteriaceae bacterium]|nr:hypothetical protein [Flavobacteriaceae bacterium]